MTWAMPRITVNAVYWDSFPRETVLSIHAVESKGHHHLEDAKETTTLWRSKLQLRGEVK